ncbi:hypothetical protein PIB30_019545 [Stylosanthes scabra]|uniref:Uncharacterized protein n=1 Tax=Stylosanthes scabra TaxID=79078 RepID=A0ABU6W6C3_9FABA|nr:hypothetical protein [Stylosanthes scabra]
MFFVLLFKTHFAATFLVLTFAVFTTFYTYAKVIPVILQELYIFIGEVVSYNAYNYSSYVLTHSIIYLPPPTSAPPPSRPPSHFLLFLIASPLPPTSLSTPPLQPRRGDSGVADLCLRVAITICVHLPPFYFVSTILFLFASSSQCADTGGAIYTEGANADIVFRCRKANTKGTSTLNIRMQNVPYGLKRDPL